ncbi:MAG: HAD-IC family P-type ATPase, partial [Candidatus Symbiothrix sp.]|nr:HAD-IC family P-type ATPase [Candidatus Symbiothrix sp.]
MKATMQTNYHTGLSDAQVLESRQKYGANLISPPEKKSYWKQYFESLEDPLIRILLVALVLSIGVAAFQFYKGMEPASVFLEPLGVLLAILMTTGAAFAFTVSANKKFDALNQVSDDTLVKVIRNGNVCAIAKKEIVVGDIVLLETGEEIPADGKLLEAISLQVNESTLTGELVAHKSVNEADFDTQATYPSYRVYKGTTVLDGHGILEVQTVGNATEAGKVDVKMQEDSAVETPLNIQLNRLAHLISQASYVIAGLIIIVRLTLYFLHANSIDWLSAGGFLLNTVMIAVTLIVVAVPEGLPMAVTLSLALSMKKMLSTNNLVRKLHACETMGAATVICTDKTGTLTQNQMQVHETQFYGLADNLLTNNEISQIITEGIAVNSTAYLDYSDSKKVKALGNPTEAALLLWLQSQGMNYLTLREQSPVVEQLTFSTERKYMATVVHSASLQKKVLYVKGAPEIVLANCQQVLVNGKLLPVESYNEWIQEQLCNYQNQAMRTLGFAFQVIENEFAPFYEGRLTADTHLVFLGISAISDPVRMDVPPAIATCFRAGIQVKIVTGDTPGTAKEIARQIGLWTEDDTEHNHLTGVEFAKLSDAALLDRILDLKVMSRARPLDKERLVKLLQQKNQVVAVTGDGTNDAPALKAAQVGLSMGDGTSVAKEASDIIILDNS